MDFAQYALSFFVFLMMAVMSIEMLWRLQRSLINDIIVMYQKTDMSDSMIEVERKRLKKLDLVDLAFEQYFLDQKI